MLKTNLTLIATIALLSIASYALLGNYQAVLAAKNTVIAAPFEHFSATKVREKRITEIQDRLRLDKQNDNLWFILGNAYMFNKEYANAVITYDYSIRLADPISADHYSAKASALYYQNNKQFNPEIKQLIEKSLSLNPSNNTALTMLATQSYLQGDTQTAINLWVKLLDSEQMNIDRVAIIQRINDAKLNLK